MIKFFKTRWFLIVGVAAVVLVSFGLYFLYKFLGGAGFGRDNYKAVSLSPAVTTVLEVGVPQEFKVVFSGDINEYAIDTRLEKTRIVGGGSPSAVEIKTRVEDGNTLIVSMGENVESYSVYTLSLTNKEDGRLLVDASYNSALQDMTPVPANNLDLTPFLPHETPSYKLSYLEDRNLYIFNFKFDPSIPGPIIDQYETAKKEAEEYIRSVGVDPGTIVIEWKHS